ncbi:hypothetical protein L9F63_018466, partial [Diploptera punctata]
VSALLLLVTGTSKSAPHIGGRLSEAEWQGYNEIEHNGPGTYAFGYDVDDPHTGNVQFREEERHPNGTVTGSYGVVEPDGNVKVVHYIADERGYRVTIENSRKQRTEITPDIKVVHAKHFTSMSTPILGHSYMHIEPRPQFTDYPTYSFQMRSLPILPYYTTFQ